MSNDNILSKKYAIMEELGRGAYGIVVRAYKRLSNGQLSYQQFAIKQIDKKKAGKKGLQELHTEVETMMLLNHPNIVRMEETFEDKNFLWIVMEYMPGGQLADLLKKEKVLPENVTKQMITYILLALNYVHEKGGFVHRDIKPSNCLLANPGETLVKIGDFGFAVLAGSGDYLTSYVGTMAFMAPEILQKISYGRAVDMWSLGVMVYQMLSGKLPFHPQRDEELSDVICAGRFNFSCSIWNKISNAAKDFICKLLVVDSSKRNSAANCLEHEWIATSMNGNSIEESLVLRNRNLRTVFRSAVLAVMICHRLLFFSKYRVLGQMGIDYPFLSSFSYIISKRYEPPHKYVDCNHLFEKKMKALSYYMQMLSISHTIETIDIRNNGIRSADVIAHITKCFRNHPSLVSLLLDGNPISDEGAKSLIGLARSTGHLCNISLNETAVSEEKLKQIRALLKKNITGEDLGRNDITNRQTLYSRQITLKSKVASSSLSTPSSKRRNN